jgi:hypothetical protein
MCTVARNDIIVKKVYRKNAYFFFVWYKIKPMADEKRSFENDRFTVLKEKEERVLQKVAEITADLETQNTGGVLSSLLRNLKGILGHFTAEETPEQKQKREEEERQKKEADECEKIIRSSWHRFSYALSVDEMKDGLKTMQADGDNEKLSTCIEKVKEVIQTKQEEELQQIVKKNITGSYKLNPEDMEKQLKEFTAKHTEDYLQPKIKEVKQVIASEKKRIDIEECRALMQGDSTTMQQKLQKYKEEYNKRWTIPLPNQDHLQAVYAEFEKAIETTKESEDETWAKELLRDIERSNYMSLPEYEKDFREYTTHCKSQKYQSAPPLEEKIKKAIDAKKVQFEKEKKTLEDSVCTNLEHRIEQHPPTVEEWNGTIKTTPLEFLAQNTDDKKFYSAEANQANWAASWDDKYNEKLCGQIVKDMSGNKSVKPCHIDDKTMTANNCTNAKNMDQYVKDMETLKSLTKKDTPELIQQKIQGLGAHIKQTLQRETKQPLIEALQKVWEAGRDAVLHKLELVDVQKDESWAEYEKLEKEYEDLVTEMTDKDLDFVPKPPDMEKEVQEAKNTRAIGAVARFTGNLSDLNTLRYKLISEGVPQTVFQTEYNAKVEALEKAATEAEIQEALRVREDFLTGITPENTADGLLKSFKEFSGKVANDDVYKKENEIREQLEKRKKEELEAQCQQIHDKMKQSFEGIGLLTSDAEPDFRELLKKSQTDWETYKKARDASIVEWKCSGFVAAVKNLVSCAKFDTNCQNVTTYLEERQAELTKFENKRQAVIKAYEKMKAQFEKPDNKQLGNELLQLFLRDSPGINVEQTYKLIWADVQEILKHRKDQETVCAKEIKRINEIDNADDKQKELDAFKQGAGQHCSSDYADIERDIQKRRQMKSIMETLLKSVDGLIMTLKTTRFNQSNADQYTEDEGKRLNGLYKAIKISIKESTDVIEKHAKETSGVRDTIKEDPIFELLKH